MEEVFNFLDNEESSDENADIDAEQLAVELEEEECEEESPDIHDLASTFDRF